MGRAFEYRKARKLKRWGNMARTFTKLGKEITIAARDGGPDPDTNPRLRVLIQTSKKENMPKDNVLRAIKRATDKEQANYEIVTYEGYAPHGVAIFVETMTDNTTRTVANLRSYFSKYGGSLGVNGSVEFLFDHKVVFTVTPKEEGKTYDTEELLLELIDDGAEDVSQTDEGYEITGDFTTNGDLQSRLEEMGFEIQSADFIREPKMTKEITPEEREEVNALIDKIEDDDDVQNVFSDMAEEADE
jgi:YebC/PmpR family DNA-binding regulatory protein